MSSLSPNCGKEMKIIAFITNHQEVKKILSISEKKTKGLLPSLLSCAMSWKTPMTGETFRQMKLIFVMQNGAFKPQGIPLSEIRHFRSAQRRNIPDHPSRQETYQKIKKRLPKICLYKPIPKCYRFV